MANDTGVGTVTNELAAIPFGSLIGGPLKAAIEAQNLAAKTTVEFIQSVGFINGKDGEVRNVKFCFRNGLYTKVPKKDDQGNPVKETVGGKDVPVMVDVPQLMVLEVPLLSIVPIPFLRIENLDIHFKASLSQSMETKQADTTSTEGKVETTVGGGFWGVKAEMKGSVSSKKDSSSTRDSRYSVEYTMDINVHAVQDDIPAGLSKVLGMLNESMERQLQAPRPVTELSAPKNGSNGNQQTAPVQQTTPGATGG